MIMATDNKNKVLNVPNLRFPEFKDVWKDSNIGRCFDLYSGNTPSRMEKEHFIGDVNWITSGELKEHYIGDTKERISEKAAADNNLRILPIGTFVMAIYGLEAEGVRGTCSITVKTSTISQACMAFTPKSNVSNEFLYSWYKKHGNKIGIRYAQGTKQQNLSYDIIEKFPIIYPSIEEQEKLNTFISLLDERIATQNKIIEDLKKLKVAIRDKAIALGIKKSAFKTLDSIADIYQPQTIPTSLLSEDAEYFVYGANGIIGKYTEYNHSEPQICIACRGNTCGTINFSTAKSWITGNAMVVNTDQYSLINKRYLYHYLSTINFNPLISGSGQPQIVRQPLAKLKIPTPSIEQQVGIVKVIDSFELKIEIEKKYLQSLLTQKVYLLSNMFI